MFKLSDKEGLKYVTDDIMKSRNELV
jgi:hypothetical protein